MVVFILKRHSPQQSLKTDHRVSAINYLIMIYFAFTSFLRPSVDIDLGRSRGRPRARSQIRDAVTPEIRQSYKKRWQKNIFGEFCKNLHFEKHTRAWPFDRRMKKVGESMKFRAWARLWKNLSNEQRWSTLSDKYATHQTADRLSQMLGAKQWGNLNGRAGSSPQTGQAKFLPISAQSRTMKRYDWLSIVTQTTIHMLKAPRCVAWKNSNFRIFWLRLK